MLFQRERPLEALAGVNLGRQEMTHSDKTLEPGGPDSSFAGLAPIPRVTLHDAVLNQVRDMIIEGKLPPGARIQEGQIGVLLGVSRTPIREAIKTLVSEGLVEIVPAKGAVVRRFSIEDIANILEALKIIEQSAGTLACERASEAQLQSIRQIHEQMLQRFRQRDRLSYFKLNQLIHTEIVRASGNPTLVEIHDHLQARIKRIRFVGNEQPDRWSGAVADHEEIIDALVARDASRLAHALGMHLDKTLARVEDAV